MTSCEPLSSERAEEIRTEVRSRYKAVSVQPEGHFLYPVGKASVLKLGYDMKLVERVPADVVDRFVGVGHPFGICRLHEGARVLDIGCGCGMDTFMAALLVGPEGHAAGLDLTDEMLAQALRAVPGSGLTNLEFRQGSAESLPFEAAVFDFVLSNGVLNMVPDKAAAFSEIARVLRPGGVFAAADLLVIETVPPEVLASKDAWSTWIAGALTGKSYLSMLHDAGFPSAEILGRTGYTTSRFTEAVHLKAVRWCWAWENPIG